MSLRFGGAWCSLLLGGLLPASAHAQAPAPGTPVSVDGPSASIANPSGLQMSIARDGTGAIAYLKQVDGVDHVFVSRLVGGAFRSPVQVDGALTSNQASSQPVIAAGNRGVLLVGFINDGDLYIADSAGISAPFGRPRQLFAGALNPSIQMTNFGKAYLAFAAPGSGGVHDVRTAYYYAGRWSVESPALNAVTGEDAGVGTGPPQVAAAGDGVAIVVWGEAGHVYSRRVWGTSPSVVVEQADAPPSGCSELTADEPVVGAGGDSSYAAVAFREQLSCGGNPMVSRVLLNRLRGSQYDGISEVDGLDESSSDGAQDPHVAVSEYQQGFVTSSRTQSNDLYADALDMAQSQGTPFAVNSLANTSQTYGFPAQAGLYSSLIAFQQDPGTGSLGIPEIRVRYSPRNPVLDREIVLSSPAQGPADAASGLAAGGDVDGNAAVAWVQGGLGQSQIMAGELYVPPGAPRPLHDLSYVTSSRPILSWRPAHEDWGPIEYRVTIDGSPAGQTTATSLRVSAALKDGPHSWRVAAVNAGGVQTVSRSATVWVDTVPPKAQLQLSGERKVGSLIQVYVRYAGANTGSSHAAPITSVLVSWGDGTRVRLAPGDHRASHRYGRAGHFRLTVKVTDRAGNVTTLTRQLEITRRTALDQPALRAT